MSNKKTGSEVDLEKLAAMIIEKRGRQNLRDAAAEIGGITAPTLSRIERGNVPDIDTFFRLCKWLETAPSKFMSGGVSSNDASDTKDQPDTPAVIGAHLRACKTLPKESAKALMTMIEVAYNAAKHGDITERSSEGDEIT